MLSATKQQNSSHPGGTLGSPSVAAVYQLGPLIAHESPISRHTFPGGHYTALAGWSVIKVEDSQSSLLFMVISTL